MVEKRFELDNVMFLVLLLMVTGVGHYHCYHDDGSGSSFSKRYRAGVGSDEIRPTASEDLPIIDLIESPNRMYDPKPTDLDVDILMERLGDGFDARFMSATDPANFSVNGAATTSTDLNYVRNKKGMLVPIGKIPKFVRKFVRKFVQLPALAVHRHQSQKGSSAYGNSFKFLHLPDGRKVRTKVSQRLRRKLRHFLWAYVFCPVRYSWKDLGVRFWPRWLREGHCLNSARSCSFPEGMSCRPNKSLGKMVLRWHCQDWDRSRYCKWIPVRYPVITSCACSC